MSQTSTTQRYNLVNSTQRTHIFKILQMRIGKQYAYMLGAYDAGIVFPCFNKQFKCVENSPFSTIDYFSVKLSSVVKFIQYHLCEKGSQFFVQHVSDICYSHSLQSVCDSQAVEHS